MVCEITTYIVTLKVTNGVGLQICNPLRTVVNYPHLQEGKLRPGSECSYTGVFGQGEGNGQHKVSNAPGAQVEYS